MASGRATIRRGCSRGVSEGLRASARGARGWRASGTAGSWTATTDVEVSAGWEWWCCWWKKAVEAAGLARRPSFGEGARRALMRVEQG